MEWTSIAGLVFLGIIAVLLIEEHSVWCQKQIEKGEHVFAKANPARTKVSCIGCHKETNLMGLNRFHKHNKEKNVTSAI